jgi:hypothetical protein
MLNRISAIGLAVAISIAAPGGASAARSNLFMFIPPGANDHDNPGINDHDSDDVQHRASHWSIVDANLVRRCVDLGSQFNRAALNTAPTSVQSAMTDYRQGVALCDAGHSAQGIDTLQAALREIGAIPYVSH